MQRREKKTTKKANLLTRGRLEVNRPPEPEEGEVVGEDPAREEVRVESDFLNGEPLHGGRAGVSSSAAVCAIGVRRGVPFPDQNLD